MISFIAAYLAFACVHSLVLISPSKVVILGNLQVTGKIINTGLWSEVDTLISNRDCQIGSGSGHGTCTLQALPAVSKCDNGYCGPNCATRDSEPVQFVSQTRTSATSLTMVFRGSPCQNLTSLDELRLVKRSCAVPAPILRDSITPTISGGQATFTWDPTNIPVPYVLCYKVNGSNSYLTITTANASFPPCVTPGHYLCPNDGSCAANCNACTNYPLLNAATTVRMCNRLLQTSITATPSCTAVMSCKGCGGAVGWPTPLLLFYDNDTTNWSQSADWGECATGVRFNQDYWIHRIALYPRSGLLYRMEKYQIFFFNSSFPPAATDTISVLRSKAFTTILDWNTVTSTAPVQTLFGPVRARYVWYYYNGTDLMNFNEFEIWGNPA